MLVVCLSFLEHQPHGDSGQVQCCSQSYTEIITSRMRLDMEIHSYVFLPFFWRVYVVCMHVC